MGLFFSAMKDNCASCINSNRIKKVTFIDIIDDIKNFDEHEFNKLNKYINNNKNRCC